MKKLPDNSIDLVVTDPPYNVSKKETINRTGGKFGNNRDIKLDFGEWDYGSILPVDYIDEFVRLLTKNGVLCLFYDKLFLGMIGFYLQEKYNFQVRHIGAWVKNNPAPQARKVKWMNGMENFLIATVNHGTGHHFNYELGQSPDYFNHVVNYEHLHPTQKPLELFKWIINYWSFEGDMILDPFIGSGTTAVACIELNRNFIGYEIDEEYYNVALKRLSKYDNDYSKQVIESKRPQQQYFFEE
ncbi:MAG: DNA-methyltransferase [archaeon]